MIDPKKCVHWRDGRCINPLRCHGGFKLVERKMGATIKTCERNGDIPQKMPFKFPGVV